MKYYLILALSVGTMHAMQKQVIPLNNQDQDQATITQSSGSSSQAPLDDQAFIRQVIHNVNISPHLVPYVAKHLRAKKAEGDIEAGDITNIVVEAANEMGHVKHEATNSRFTKKHTAGITLVTTIIGAIITALASTYQSNSKC